MTCQELVGYLSDYIDRNLDEALAREAAEHLASCDKCHVVLDTTRATISLYRQAMRAPIAPERRRRLLERVRTAAGDDRRCL